MRLAALLVVLLLLVAGCGGDENESAATTTAPTTTSEQTTTAGPTLSPRCIQGTTVITNALASGLRVKRHSLRSVYAVKSTAFGSVFLVSARVQGAPSNPIGTWATNNLNLGGLMFSIDPVAKKFSRWALGATFDKSLTMKLDGARESRACVKQASG